MTAMTSKSKRHRCVEVLEISSASALAPRLMARVLITYVLRDVVGVSASYFGG